MNTRRFDLAASRTGFRALVWLMGIVVATSVAVGATASPAQAKYYSGGMPNCVFNVRPIGVNSTWAAYFDTARIRWNNTDSGTRIGRSASAPGELYAGRYSQSWYGLYSPHGPRDSSRTFAIRVNARTIEQKSGSYFENWVMSVSVHELGHSLSLGDNPSTGNLSIMNYSRDRRSLVAPTYRDAAEVRRIY